MNDPILGWTTRAASAAALLVLCSVVLADASAQDSPTQDSSTVGVAIPIVDISADHFRQTVVDREDGQYLGHPTTVLLEDGQTILTVYPQGHGRGAIVFKRSTDGGLTWSDRLPVPDSWLTSQEVPTIYRVVGPDGARRLLLFSGLYPIRMSYSNDDGSSWSELQPIGDFGGIVAMASLVRLTDGRLRAFFHDDGRFIQGTGEQDVFRIYSTTSDDGGLTWSSPKTIVERADVDLCEPGAVWSPDGRQLALLLRENSRTRGSFIVFSGDEGASWSDPLELPDVLTGDRHTARYLADGRVFISFRDMGLKSATQGDWVGWVGTYDDLLHRREGQYRVRIMDNKDRWDSTYPGVEILPDGTIVTTTYGHWEADAEPYIVSVRFRTEELEQILRVNR